jgi:hypothetical protein
LSQIQWISIVLARYEAELIQYFQPEINALAKENELSYEETLAGLKKY